jgi:uncharacterized membrane protein YbaN (DUF454 family)
LRARVEVVTGFGLVALGVLGLVLPVMPGWILLIPGVVILARHYRWARRLLALVQRKRHRDANQQPPGGGVPGS